MRALLLGLLLAISQPLYAKTFDQQDTVVQLYARGGPMCSAVVIRPGVLVSAGHCLIEGNVDSVVTPAGTFKITRTEHRSPANDTLIVYADGVPCPCAKVELSGVVLLGETVVAAGHPGDWGLVVSLGEVIDVDQIRKHFPQFEIPKDNPVGDWILLFHSAMTAPGMSGGGVFVERNGEWVLIGVNSIVVPMFNESGSTPLAAFRGL